SPEPAELHRGRTDAPVHAGNEVGTPFDGDRDLSGGGCRNRGDIPIKPLGARGRWQRGACNVRACAHRHFEQVSGVVSSDISPDDYSGGARGCAAASAPEQRPQPGLLPNEITLDGFEEFLWLNLIAASATRFRIQSSCRRRCSYAQPYGLPGRAPR